MQCNYRQSSTKISFKFALQMQRYRQHTAIAQSQRSIAQSKNSKLFRRQTSPFLSPKTTNPLKSKRENSKENIYTPKFRLLHCLTTKFTLLAGRCQRHVRTVQKLAIECRRSSTSAEVGNLRISIEIISDLYRNCVFTAIRLYQTSTLSLSKCTLPLSTSDRP